MFKVSPVPIASPSPDEIAKLVFRPAQSIAPQGRYNMVLGQPIAGEPYTPEQLKGAQTLNSYFQDIKTKKVILYLYGILRYDDVSGQQRETQFCVFLADPDKKLMGFCDGFNEMN
jgi:hypothetical protein